MATRSMIISDRTGKIKEESMNTHNEVLSKVKEVRETQDIREVAQLLSSGKWIAICATPDEPYLFSLGRVVDYK